MSSFKVVKVVREVMKYTLSTGKIDFNDPDMIVNLSKKGIKRSEISECLDQLHIISNNSNRCNDNISYRQFSEVEHQYLSPDLKAFVLLLSMNEVLTHSETEEFINFLIAMANSRLDLNESRPLIIEFFNQQRMKDKLLLVLSELDCCRRKNRIH
ncbi:MAG: hypothetical protein Kow00108_12210 [Calditrichia bacterium]